MSYETNRIALYLAGKLPPYYKPFHKIEFMEKLGANSDSIFTEDVFDFIEKHTSSDQQFYSECLNRLNTYSEELLEQFVEILKIPADAKGVMISKEVIKEEIKTLERTIGFITPFDDDKDKLQSFIQGILDTNNPGWRLETALLSDDGDGKLLRNVIKDFLEKYPIYIVDLRNKNLNVAIELGYILSTGKPSLVLVNKEDQYPSDLSGFVYVPKPQGKLTVGGTDDDAKEEQDRMNKEFEKNLLAQLKRYI